MVTLGRVWLQSDLSLLHVGNSHVHPLASTIDGISICYLGEKSPTALFRVTAFSTLVGRAWAGEDAADAVSLLFVDVGSASQH